MAGLLGIVFSKDRALQLDLALRSLQLHWRDAVGSRISVLYRTSTVRHARQYAALAEEYSRASSRVEFIPEHNFRADLLRIAFGCRFSRTVARVVGRGERTSLPRWLKRLPVSLLVRHSCILFLVDDAVFVSDFSLGEVRHALARCPRALGFSLRLGENTVKCYTADSPQSLPHFRGVDGDIRIFDWTSGERDFGYPLEVSSSVYRTVDVLPLLVCGLYSEPNTLEAHLAKQVGGFVLHKPHLLCFRTSVAFCNPVNMVQQTYPNRCGTANGHSAERLAELFDEGYQIDAAAYSGFVPNACHQEREVISMKRQRVGSSVASG